MINNKFNAELALLFRPFFLHSIIKGEHSKCLLPILNKSGYHCSKKNTLAKMFDDVYHHLTKRYRCEYVYKNTIIKNILLGRHSLNSSVALSELRANKSKSDLVIVNGTSTVYEIKSELDCLDRLPYQVADYLKLFDIVNVVTYAQNVKKIIDIVPPRVGILCLTNKNSISVYRTALSNKCNVEPDAIFSSLTKKEYLNIVKDKFEYIPNVPNTKIYKECKSLFCSLSPDEAHAYLIDALKSRKIKSYKKDIVRRAPYSLKSLCLFSHFTQIEADIFIDNLFSYNIF